MQPLKNFTLVFCLIGLTATLVLGQPSDGAAVFGEIVEYETEAPLEFVDVVLYENSVDSFLTGTTTDPEGKFRFTGISPGKYFLEISFIGFETKRTKVLTVTRPDEQLDLKKIAIKLSSVLLDEIEVVSEKSTYSYNINRKVYNVEQDIMSQSGTATEMLQNLPSVRVDPNGQISLRGTTNVTFFINGRPSALLRANSASALQSIPANTIERIEVITNPSARYRPDGIGGIINIVLKDASLDGFNGNVQASVGNLDRYNGNLTLNYGGRDVNIYGSYGFRNASTPQDILDTRVDRDGSGGVLGTFNSLSDAIFDERSHLLNGGMDLAVGESGHLEIAGNYIYLKSDNNSLTNWEVQEEIFRKFSVDRTYDSFEKEYEASAAYEREFDSEDHTLAIEFVYAGYDEKEDNIYIENYAVPFAANARSHFLIDKGGPQAEFSVEYARPVGLESELEIGYAGEFLRDDIRLLGEDFDPDNKTWITDLSKTNQFKFNQNVHALFGLYGHSIEDFSFEVGLRAEQALINSNLISTLRAEEVPNDYFRLYPSLLLAYEFSDYEVLQLSYGKRVNRADSDEHNPFPEYDDPRTRDLGNPRLLPEQVHSAELAYRKQGDRFSFFPSLYYRYKYDGFTELRQIVEDSVLETTFINFARETSAGMELVLSGRIGDGLQFNFGGNAFYNEVDGTNIGFPNNKSNIAWDAKLAANVNITNTTNAQVNAQYYSSRLTPQGEFRPLFLLNFGLQQDILKKQASLTFTVSDVFASLEWESVIDTPNLYWNTTYGRNNQIFHLGFTYRFGKSYSYSRNREKMKFEDQIEPVDSEKPEKEEEEEEE